MAQEHGIAGSSTDIIIDIDIFEHFFIFILIILVISVFTLQIFKPT